MSDMKARPKFVKKAKHVDDGAVEMFEGRPIDDCIAEAQAAAAAASSRDRIEDRLGYCGITVDHVNGGIIFDPNYAVDPYHAV